MNQFAFIAVLIFFFFLILPIFLNGKKYDTLLNIGINLKQCNKKYFSSEC